MGMKILDDSELKEFWELLNIAEWDLGPQRDSNYWELFNNFEWGFTLIGATCVEDWL